MAGKQIPAWARSRKTRNGALLDVFNSCEDVDKWQLTDAEGMSTTGGYWIPKEDPEDKKDIGEITVYARRHKNKGGIRYHPETGLIHFREVGVWLNEQMVVKDIDKNSLIHEEKYEVEEGNAWKRPGSGHMLTHLCGGRIVDYQDLKRVYMQTLDPGNLVVNFQQIYIIRIRSNMIRSGVSPIAIYENDGADLFDLGVRNILGFQLSSELKVKYVQGGADDEEEGSGGVGAAAKAGLKVGMVVHRVDMRPSHCTEPNEWRPPVYENCVVSVLKQFKTDKSGNGCMKNSDDKRVKRVRDGTGMLMVGERGVIKKVMPDHWLVAFPNVMHSVHVEVETEMKNGVEHIHYRRQESWPIDFQSIQNGTECDLADKPSYSIHRVEKQDFDKLMDVMGERIADPDNEDETQEGNCFGHGEPCFVTNLDGEDKPMDKWVSGKTEGTKIGWKDESVSVDRITQTCNFKDSDGSDHTISTKDGKPFWHGSSRNFPAGFDDFGPFTWDGKKWVGEKHTCVPNPEGADKIEHSVVKKPGPGGFRRAICKVYEKRYREIINAKEGVQSDIQNVEIRDKFATPGDFYKPDPLWTQECTEYNYGFKKLPTQGLPPVDFRMLCTWESEDAGERTARQFNNLCGEHVWKGQTTALMDLYGGMQEIFGNMTNNYFQEDEDAMMVDYKRYVSIFFTRKYRIALEEAGGGAPEQGGEQTLGMSAVQSSSIKAGEFTALADLAVTEHKSQTSKEVGRVKKDDVIHVTEVDPSGWRAKISESSGKWQEGWVMVTDGQMKLIRPVGGISATKTSNTKSAMDTHKAVCGKVQRVGLPSRLVHKKKPEKGPEITSSDQAAANQEYNIGLGSMDAYGGITMNLLHQRRHGEDEDINAGRVKMCYSCWIQFVLALLVFGFGCEEIPSSGGQFAPFVATTLSACVGVLSAILGFVGAIGGGAEIEEDEEWIGGPDELPSMGDPNEGYIQRFLACNFWLLAILTTFLYSEIVSIDQWTTECSGATVGAPIPGAANPGGVPQTDSTIGCSDNIAIHVTLLVLCGAMLGVVFCACYFAQKTLDSVNDKAKIESKHLMLTYFRVRMYELKHFMQEHLPRYVANNCCEMLDNDQLAPSGQGMASGSFAGGRRGSGYSQGSRAGTSAVNWKGTPSRNKHEIGRADPLHD